MTKLIFYDQTGFIKGRLAADNLCRLFHVIDVASTLKMSCGILSLDAEKAFYRLEWGYLSETFWFQRQVYLYGKNIV